MNIQKIKDKLSERFRNPDRRQIVFWYDKSREFEEEIKTLELENAKIHILTGKNYFETKLLLEIQDTKTHYLIYAPFKKPEDAKNSLADIYHYSLPAFSADKTTLIADELEIPHTLRQTIEKYSIFWNSKERLDKFKSVTKILKPDTEQNIALGILAVLSGLKYPSFDKILKKVIYDEYNGKNPLDEFEKYKVSKNFWELCREKYEYHAEKPTFDKLLKTLFVTDICQHIPFTEKEFPGKWETYKVKHTENVDNIIKSIRDSSDCRKTYDLIAEEYAKQLNVEDVLKEIPMEKLIDCDTFEYFDKILTSYLNECLMSNSRAPEFISKLNKRSSFHYSTTYNHLYEMLTAADDLLRLSEEYKKTVHTKKPEEFFCAYKDKWYEIDTHYRLFYTAYDKINYTSDYYKLRNKIEWEYNHWIDALNAHWSNLLEKTTDKLSSISLPAQHKFYQTIVKPDAERYTTIVIISDGLRYECAKGVLEEFRKAQEASVTIEAMLSNIPTYTELGMASLLPHSKISMIPEDNFSVRVDDKICEGTENREKILQTYNPNSAAFAYAFLIGKTRDELRGILGGKNLIYIYHNQIDAIGDKYTTETQIFKACSDAIGEIKTIIMKLTHALSYTNYIVTADHGFSYTRGEVNESDKLTVDKQIKDNSTSYHKRRYILGTKKAGMPNTIEYPLDYLGPDTASIYAAVPKATEIFKKQSAGQNYVHGGYSLQECCLPVLRIKSIKSKVELEKVSIRVMSKSKITNISEFVTFMQTDPCSESVLPLKAVAWFENEAGDKITTKDITILADKKDKEEFREKFTFKKMQYSKSEKYYLVIHEEENDEEILKMLYTIDIAFIPQF